MPTASFARWRMPRISSSWIAWATRSPSCPPIWTPLPPACSFSSASSTPAAGGASERRAPAHSQESAPQPRGRGDSLVEMELKETSHD